MNKKYYKKLESTSYKNYKVGELVDVPYVNGYVRLELESFSNKGDKIYTHFENDLTICEVEELKKIKTK